MATSSVLPASTQRVASSLRKVGALSAEDRVIVGRRDSAPVHSAISRLVFGKDELAPPDKDDVKNWVSVLEDMQRSRPYQLADATVLSGNASPRHLVNSTQRRETEDTLMEQILGNRSEAAQFYASIPSSAIAHTDASYHTLPNSVILNERSPGVLIHELGHAIDLSRGPNESKLRRNLREMFKPTLMAEHAAWRKGKDAYVEGYAASDSADNKERMEKFKENVRSIASRKYPALGTYWGGALGGLGGGALGLAVPLIMAANTDDQISRRALARLAGYTALGGAAVGSLGGILSGGVLGAQYGKYRANSLVEKEIARVQKIRGNKRRLEKLLASQAREAEFAERDNRGIPDEKPPKKRLKAAA